MTYSNMVKVNAYTTNAPAGGIEYGQIDISNSEGNVTLKPILTGICGTDRGMVRGSLSFAYNPAGYQSIVIGHESLCLVTDSLSKEFSKGDMVVPIVRRPGDCPNCRIGRPDNCSDGNKHEAGITGLNGFMRDSFSEHDYNLVKVLDKSLGDVAVLTEPTKNVVKAFEVFERVKTRFVYEGVDSTLGSKNALIIGSGSEAFLYSFMATDYGFNTYMTNRHPVGSSEIELCNAFGVEFHDSSKEPNFPESFKLDLVIDTSGDPEAIFNYLRKMEQNGILILFGTNGRAQATPVSGEDIDFIVERNITLAGSVDAAKIHYFKALDYLSKWNRLHPGLMQKIITNRFKPGEVSLFTVKPQGEIKSVIKWD
jgi:glucose/galactose 1-dehydrogenase (NADP+)/aldose 1-dehydrogenase [NAD(P)+]